VTVVALAGCGSSGKQAQSTTTGSANSSANGSGQKAPPAGAGERCLAVSSQLLSRIQAHVVLEGGKLNHPQAVASPEVPGLYFVSAHVVGGGAGSKMVATWATKDLAGHARIFSVDDAAALVSTYGSIYSTGLLAGIHSEGAFKSRVCSYGKGAPQGNPAPQSGGPGGNPTS